MQFLPWAPKGQGAQCPSPKRAFRERRERGVPKQGPPRGSPQDGASRGVELGPTDHDLLSSRPPGRVTLTLNTRPAPARLRGVLLRRPAALRNRSHLLGSQFLSFEPTGDCLDGGSVRVKSHSFQDSRSLIIFPRAAVSSSSQSWA